MIEYIHFFFQAALDALTMYLISSLVVAQGIKWGRQSLYWLLWFLLFCILSRSNFIASESVHFLGVDIENYDILPVNSWDMLILLFFTVLILNSAFYRIRNKEAIYVTVVSFMIWIIVRLISVMVVGLFIQDTLIDRIVSLLIIVALLISPIDTLLRTIRVRNTYTKILLLISLFVLVFILISYNFNQRVLMSDAWIVWIVLIFIVALNLWIFNEQRRNLVQENRLTVIENYIPVIDDLVSEMRGKQHEFNNKLLAISSIVETEQHVETIREKVREYTDYALPKHSSQQLLSVNHKVIAGFLYSKMKLAEWKKIKIMTEITTDFKGFQSNEYDWIEVLGILLDNAIEATLPSEEIKVTLNRNNDLLELCVSNPANYMTNTELMNMFEQGYTTKSSESRHRGYGLFALKQLTNEYQGKIITKNEVVHRKNYVTIGVLLP